MIVIDDNGQSESSRLCLDLREVLFECFQLLFFSLSCSPQVAAHQVQEIEMIKSRISWLSIGLWLLF